MRCSQIPGCSIDTAAVRFVCGRKLASRRLVRKPSQLRASVEQQEDLDVEDKGQASVKDKEAAESSGTEIYIGFDKSDVTPRAGRKGRLVTDDPSRYPERDSLTGGWAGGEVGLQQFIQEDERQGKNVEQAKVIGKDKKGRKKAVTSGGEEVSVGLSEEEREKGRESQDSRQPERPIQKDDPRKYPNKENFGLLSGITGGFAGGEKGVQQFVERGDIQLAEKSRREASPIIIAALVAGGVTTGAILLNSGVLISEQAFTSSFSGGAAGGSATSSSASGLSIDPNTKLLLNLAFALVGLGSLGIGIRSLTKRLQRSTIQLKDDALNVGRIAIFWILVLVAALYIIDSQ